MYSTVVPSKDPIALAIHKGMFPVLTNVRGLGTTIDPSIKKTIKQGTFLYRTVTSEEKEDSDDDEICYTFDD